MLRWLAAVDRILRGEATRPAQLRDGTIDIPAGGVALVLTFLGAAYGFCMGWYALFNRDDPEYQQLLASTVKVPALFVLTLIVTFPSLYVFNALVGSRLRVLALLRLLVASLAVTLSVLASFGPITAFFSVTAGNYSFIQFLNVMFFAIAGGLGLLFLLQTLHRLTRMIDLPAAVVEPDPAGDPAAPPPLPLAGRWQDPRDGALQMAEGDALRAKTKLVFLCWVVLYAAVGAQMSWVLRPFIGNPYEPFTWFRPRQSNFFEAVTRILRDLFGS